MKDKKVGVYNPHISLCMMVKNEEDSITKSLNSCKGYINSVVLYDTGSTDKTIENTKNWCEENKIPFRLKEGTFVNFSESRNVLLEFVDTFQDIDYALLFDSADQLKGGEELLRIAKEYYKKENTSFMLRQEWLTGNTVTKYYNIRLIKPRNNWRYHEPVHEYIARADHITNEPISEEVPKIETALAVFQDRNADGAKSQLRFKRDKEIFLEEIKKNPTNSRSYFYLGQTYECLGDHANAMYYYTLRTEMTEGFYEEIFHAYMRIADCMYLLKYDIFDAIKYYLKAFNKIPRAEPISKAAQLLTEIQDFKSAYMYAKMACQLPYPVNNTLFIDDEIYRVKRWQLLAISAYYSDFLIDGRFASKICLKEEPNNELYKNNAKFYTDDELKTKNIDFVEYLSNKIKEHLIDKRIKDIDNVVKIALRETNNFFKNQKSTIKN